MKKPIILLVILLAGSMAACNNQTVGSKKFTIAVVPKGTTHPFWKSVNAGAMKAAADYKAQGVEADLIWKGPLREDDREQQIQVVEGFISQGVNGIVLAPLDNKALVRPVEEAKRAGVPTVIIDSGLDSDQITSFAATDNLKGGNMAAERLGELLGGKGKVIMLRYLEGSASTTDREEGFLEVMRSKFPGIELISSDQYAGATRDSAKRTAENLLQRFGDQVTGDNRHAARAPGPSSGWEDHVRWVRLQSAVCRGDEEQSDAGDRRAESVRHRRAGSKGDDRQLARQAGRKKSRHGRHDDHA